MGVGDPLEAAITLPAVASFGAGAWHLVADGVILAPVDVRFDVLLRQGGGDRTLATFAHHFDVPADPQAAAPLDADAPGIAATAQPGDLLVLRMTASNARPGAAYLPNADGPHTGGRIPSITPP